MTAKNILTIFIVSLFAAAAPAESVALNDDHFKDFNLCKLKDTYVALAPSKKDNTLKPTAQLMKAIMFDLQNLGLYYNRRAKAVSDNLLKDASIISNKSPAVVAFKETIEEYERKYSSCGEMEELFNLVDLYSAATSKYYKMEKEGTLNADSQLIYDVLKKYSPKHLDDEFENEFLKIFVSKIGQKINDMKEELKKEEGCLGVQVLQWWDKTKSLETTKEKMNAVKDYVILNEEDDL